MHNSRVDHEAHITAERIASEEARKGGNAPAPRDPQPEENPSDR